MNPLRAEKTKAGDTAPRVVAVIPTYRAGATIRRVVERTLQFVDAIYVVDDCCPDDSGSLVAGIENIYLLRHEMNRGVGGATKTGMSAALRDGADIIVKVDADDQMEVAFIPAMVATLVSSPEVDAVKGNRFADSATLRVMPMLRLIGNACLTLLVKFSSGYWSIVDPTNGFIAIRAAALRATRVDHLADRYFFEIDLLCALGLARRIVAEIEMPAIYAGARSSLSIARVVLTFPPRLIARFLRRLLMQYIVVEINVGSLCGLIGLPLLTFATLFGAHEWAASIATGVARPTGTIVLALLLFMIGFQLSMQALLYDVQFATRTVKVRREVGSP